MGLCNQEIFHSHALHKGNAQLIQHLTLHTLTVVPRVPCAKDWLHDKADKPPLHI